MYIRMGMVREIFKGSLGCIICSWDGSILCMWCMCVVQDFGLSYTYVFVWFGIMEFGILYYTYVFVWFWGYGMCDLYYTYVFVLG